MTKPIVSVLVDYLDHVYSVDSFDERKPRWNAVSMIVTDWFNAQQTKQEEVSESTLAFIHRVRDTIPSPYTLEKFKEEYLAFKKNLVSLSGVTSGRTSGAKMSSGNLPRSAQTRPVEDSVLLHSSTFETQTYHHPSPSYDCSPSDSGGSDGGGGGCGD